MLGKAHQSQEPRLSPKMVNSDLRGPGRSTRVATNHSQWRERSLCEGGWVSGWGSKVGSLQEKCKVQGLSKSLGVFQIAPYLLAKSQSLPIRYLAWVVENVNTGNLAHAAIQQCIRHFQAYSSMDPLCHLQAGRASFRRVTVCSRTAAQPRGRTHSSAIGNTSLLF